MEKSFKYFLIIISIVFLSGFIFINIIKNNSIEDNQEWIETKLTEKKEIKSFHYQLQNTKYSELNELDVDLIVVDIDDSGLSEQELSDLQKEKIVLSYLSIGEAEEYRDYWQTDWKTGNPLFIDEENPDWGGNYKVMYWNSFWQWIILNKVEEIARKGYDGVYLDIIDAYEYYEEKGRKSAADEMIYFVMKIKDKGKSINPNFLVFPQNAPELYEFEDYKKTIDGIGKEDLWYNNNQEQKLEEINYNLNFLDKIKKDGKIVMVIDYPTQQSNICDFYSKCNEKEFICLVSDRDLDKNNPMLCN